MCEINMVQQGYVCKKENFHLALPPVIYQSYNLKLQDKGPYCWKTRHVQKVIQRKLLIGQFECTACCIHDMKTVSCDL